MVFLLCLGVVCRMPLCVYLFSFFFGVRVCACGCLLLAVCYLVCVVPFSLLIACRLVVVSC